MLIGIFASNFLLFEKAADNMSGNNIYTRIIITNINLNRYIEIFRSSLSEVRASIGPKMRGGPMGGFNQRPAPYDRGSRFGGMNRFSNNSRGSRNRGTT